MDKGKWGEWQEAVQRTGYTPALKRAAEMLEKLDRMTVAEVEELFRQRKTNQHREGMGNGTQRRVASHFKDCG